MCTLSFVPANGGYIVAMNRDELRTRAVANPPSQFVRNDVAAVYPSEPSGGTWIAANDRGNTLAVLNWNGAGTEEVGAPGRVSRGTIVPALIFAGDQAQTETALRGLQLGGIAPFRLAGVFGREQVLQEWRWNGRRLESWAFAWQRRHWFSSSLSDVAAAAQRGSVFQDAAEVLERDPAGELPRLHRSHVPEPGPFSVCVHRPDASTVSYTEVRCAAGEISLSYLAGNPCAPIAPSAHCGLALHGAATRTGGAMPASDETFRRLASPIV